MQPFIQSNIFRCTRIQGETYLYFYQSTEFRNLIRSAISSVRLGPLSKNGPVDQIVFKLIKYRN